ncbi:DAK2 domain-containing protein [Actinomadura sp. HBU206391]|uniref:DAK2 domain-containing protein n=1 Tax=Actinomadura sp. HBU206391 TaxID=2731692 RepID=UPI00164FBD72|nr:DAK2 domain-containing protein [Actinomadura sp. HBU206391]MBC6462288.1 DAK2 domain-containing protein [Actinomadura sp. HBU206391]
MREILDASGVRHWCGLAAEALGRIRGEIDGLNVFPVPDRDTGTNLHLTVLAAAEALAGLPPDAGAEETWRALAQGALLGARGNSGVILSQVFLGLADVLGKPGVMADGQVLDEALGYAAALARTAVAHPVEGTILSVLTSAAAATAAEPATGGPTLAAVARAAAEAARSALSRTPEQLDVLARNGVVDAGGAGLCVVLETLAAVITDEFPDGYAVPARAPVPGDGGTRLPGPAEPVDRGYEVMYLLDAPDDAVPALRQALDGLGDSLVVVGGEGLWNVHVHVDDAGAAIEAGLATGRPHRVRVTCLHAAPHGAGGPQAPCTGRGVVAVTAAGGLASLFESCGARVVRREPGAVPPVTVLVEAILAAGDEVVVLPGDPDVLTVAEAAAERAGDSGVRIAVLPTEASVQGLAALAVHDALRRFDDDVIAMTRAAGATRFGHVEIAGQEAVTSAGICQPGDVLGLIEGDVCVIGTDLTEVGLHILGRMLAGGGELVTLITGLAAPPGVAAVVEGRLRAERPDVEFVVYEGGQERRPLLIGVE